MSTATALVDRAARVQRSPAALAVLGLLLVALVVGVIGLILVTFSGAFTDYVPVQAVISGTGNSVSKGYQVVYQEIPVGTVASATKAEGVGQAVVSVHLIPSRADHIPANVTAEVAPVTIFGTEDLILEAPKTASTSHLVPGDVISAAPTSGAANLQGAVTSLDSILKALHPAQLDTALTAIATALNGQGTGLGRTLSSLDTYLDTMLPHFPLLEADLGLLAPLANQVAASAPALVGSLSNLTVTSETVTSEANQLHDLLADGATVAGQLHAVLAPTEQPLENILAAAGPFFSDASQSPTELTRILSGLSAWATSWSSAEAAGPYLSFSTSVPVANAADVVFAALGSPSKYCDAQGVSCAAEALGAQHVDPATYTSRSTPATTSVQIDPAIVSPAEAERTAVLAADLDGGRRVGSPAAVSLLLDPLLSGLAVGS